MSKKKPNLLRLIFQQWLIAVIEVLNRELDKAEAEQSKEEKKA